MLLKHVDFVATTSAALDQLVCAAHSHQIFCDLVREASGQASRALRGGGGSEAGESLWLSCSALAHLFEVMTCGG